MIFYAFKTDSMDAKYKTCLRPQFTQTIFEQLLADHSLNPYGPKGTGKGRLLDDLLDLAQRQGLQVLRFDLATHQDHYASFLQQAEFQLRIYGARHQRARISMLGRLNEPTHLLPSFDYLIKEAELPQSRLLILMENLDALTGHGLHDFPETFFHQLNAIKNTPGLTLCCTTVQSHQGSDFYFHAGRQRRSSFLELQPLPISPLTLAEIRQTLHQRLEGSPNWEQHPQQQAYLRLIQQAPHPMIYLQLVANDFLHPNFPKELNMAERTAHYDGLYQRYCSALVPNVSFASSSRFSLFKK